MGGAAAAWVKAAEQEREDQAKIDEQLRADRTAWSNILDDVVEVDQTLAVARQLIAAHKTAKTYRRTVCKLSPGAARAPAYLFDPLVANDQRGVEEGQSIQSCLDLMKSYVDKLGEEYEKNYLRVARQQRVDEEYLKRRASEEAAPGSASRNDIDHINAKALDCQRTPDFNDPIYQPTEAWRMLQDPTQFRLLTAFLDEFEGCDFVRGFAELKPMLERRGGIDERKDEFKPEILSTHTG